MVVAGFLILGVFLLVLQTTLLQILPPWLGRPDMLFVLIVFLAFQVDIIRGAILVFLLGLINDVFSGIFLGLYPIVFLLVFFSIKAAAKNIAFKESIYQAPLAAASYLVTCSAVFVITVVLGPDNPPQWSWGVVTLQVLLTAVIALPLFSIFDFLLRTLSRKKIGPYVFKTKSDNRFRT